MAIRASFAAALILALFALTGGAIFSFFGITLRGRDYSGGNDRNKRSPCGCGIPKKYKRLRRRNTPARRFIVSPLEPVALIPHELSVLSRLACLARAYKSVTPVGNPSARLRACRTLAGLPPLKHFEQPGGCGTRA